MADDDDGFKICGLCAQLPEESVAVTHDLAVFIADFLAGSLSRVPSKVCTECVQSAEDAKIFRNKCIKGTNKIRARNLPDSMILGGTTGKSVKSLSPGKQKGGGPAAAAAAASKFVTPSPPPLKKPRTSEVDNLITADVFEDKPRGGRGGPASRKSAGKPPPAAVETFYEEPLATSTGKRPGRRSATASVTSNGAGAGAGGGVPQAKIRIPNFEHSLAQEALTDGSVNYKDARKRKSINDSLNSLSSPSAVAARPKRISKADEALINGAQVDATSSFGRLRKPTAKRNYTGYSDDDDATSFGGGDNDEGFVPGGGRRSSSNKSPNKKLATPKSAGAAAKKGAAAAKKPGPKSRPGGGKAAAAANNSNNFYYVDDSHQPNGNGPTVEIENVDVDALPTSTSVDDPNENLEEAFPSVGPYQCEICQEVTDTKQQFVDHIKQFHRDVVDQEVLTTLEDDLRKAKKKAEKAKAGSPSKNAVAAAGTSKKRTTSAAAKPASAFKTQVHAF